MATELEFYLCNADWSPVQSHIQYSSLTDALELEDVFADMRSALIELVWTSNRPTPNTGRARSRSTVAYNDALTTADDTVLFRSIVKQVAVQHGMQATFMPKPWMDHPAQACTFTPA